MNKNKKYHAPKIKNGPVIQYIKSTLFVLIKSDLWLVSCVLLLHQRYHIMIKLCVIIETKNKGFLFVLSGLIKDYVGTYDGAFFVGSAGTFLGGIILLFGNIYRYRQQRKESST